MLAGGARRGAGASRVELHEAGVAEQFDEPVAVSLPGRTHQQPRGRYGIKA